MSVLVVAEPGPALTTPPAITTPTQAGIRPVHHRRHHLRDVVLHRWVEHAVAGDARARERLLTEIHPRVVRYCRAWLGPHYPSRHDTRTETIDDVAEGICLAVVTALPRWSPNGHSFYRFVYAIAACKVVDALGVVNALGARGRRDPSTPAPERPATTLILHKASPPWLPAGDLPTPVGELLELLDPAHREVMVLRIAVGLSAQETAQALGTTENAVQITQHDALNRLRDLIATHRRPDTTAAATAGATLAPVIPHQRRRSH